MRQRYGDGTRAGTHVNDASIHSKADVLQRCFDQMLGFRTGDKDIRGYFEEQAEKLLRASDVLHGLAGQASLEQAFKLLGFSWGE